MKRALLIFTALLAGGITVNAPAAGLHTHHHHHYVRHHHYVHRHHLRHYTYRTIPGTTYSYSSVAPAPVVQPAPQGPVVLVQPTAPVTSASAIPGIESGFGPGGSGMPGGQAVGGIGR